MRWRDMVDWSLTWHDGWQSSLSFNTSLPPTHTWCISLMFLPETPFSSLPPFFQYLPHLHIFFQYLFHLTNLTVQYHHYPHLATHSLKGNLVIKGLNWSVELTPLPLTHTFISLKYTHSHNHIERTYLTWPWFLSCNCCLQVEPSVSSDLLTLGPQNTLAAVHWNLTAVFQQQGLVYYRAGKDVHD